MISPKTGHAYLAETTWDDTAFIKLMMEKVATA